jgi:hypothetical protein
MSLSMKSFEWSSAPLQGQASDRDLAPKYHRLRGDSDVGLVHESS